MAFSIVSACSNSPLPAIDMSKAILLTRFSMLLVLVSVSKLFSPYMCLDDVGS